MELSRWVLPTPGGPHRNSGLYAWAGISATASAAACARRLQSPMTNWSKVSLGLPSGPDWAQAGVTSLLAAVRNVVRGVSDGGWVPRALIVSDELDASARAEDEIYACLDDPPEALVDPTTRVDGRL